MLRFAILLALVAVGCCSAFSLQVPDSVHAYVAAQGKASAGGMFYFPCDGVTVRQMESLDLNRYRGHWYMTNTAFSTSHKIDTDNIQKGISQTVSCVINGINATNPNAPVQQQLVSLRTAVNQTVTIPGWTVVENGTALFRSMNATLPRQGDNGKWQLRVDLGNSTTLLLDLWIVATDYTNVATWYSCQDIPVPGTADTAREQQWGLFRRQPRNFNSIELAALRLIAMSRGIADADRLYTFPTDGC